MDNKTLVILGGKATGKKTLLGSFIYKCGTQLSQLEAMERNERTTFADIIRFYGETGRTQSFFAPRAEFSIGESSTCDVMVWVVDVTEPTTWESSSQELATLLSSGEVNPEAHLLIAVNKMDLVGWSDEIFEEALRVFESIDFGVYKTYIVPISALRGQNVLAITRQLAWVKDFAKGSSNVKEFVSDQPLIYLF